MQTATAKNGAANAKGLPFAAWRRNAQKGLAKAAAGANCFAAYGAGFGAGIDRLPFTRHTPNPNPQGTTAYALWEAGYSAAIKATCQMAGGHNPARLHAPFGVARALRYAGWEAQKFGIPATANPYIRHGQRKVPVAAKYWGQGHALRAHLAAAIERKRGAH